MPEGTLQHTSCFCSSSDTATRHQNHTSQATKEPQERSAVFAVGRSSKTAPLVSKNIVSNSLLQTRLMHLASVLSR